MTVHILDLSAVRTRLGILHVLELLVDGLSAEALAPPFDLAIEDGFGQQQSVDLLGHAVALGEGGLLGDKAEDVPTDVGVAGHLEAEVERRAVGRTTPDVDTRFADALHGDQEDHHPRPLGGVGPPAGAGGAVHGTASQHGPLGGPLLSQGGDCMGRDVADLSGPFRSAGYAVLLTEYVGLELLEAYGAVLDEPVVVSVLGDPHVSNSLGQSSVGRRAGCEPLLTKVRGG